MKWVGSRKFGNISYVIQFCLGYFRIFLMRLVIRKKKFKGVLERLKCDHTKIRSNPIKYFFIVS